MAGPSPAKTALVSEVAIEIEPPRRSLKKYGQPSLLRCLRQLLEIGRVAQVHRCVPLERIGGAEVVADLAHPRHHLLAEAAEACAGVLGRPAACIAPDTVHP